MSNSILFKRLLIFNFFLLLMAVNLNAATLEVSTTQINAGCQYTEASVQVTSDTYWEIYCDDDWINYDYSWNYGNYITVFRISSNNSFISRTGTITLVASGGLTKTITVTQAGLSADNYEANNNEATASNVNYVFNNNVATLELKGTFHNNSDVDYFKTDLPAGYKYEVSMQMMYNYIDNYTYVNVSGKVDNGSWSSSTYSADLLSNSGILYLMFSPYYTGSTGSYTCDVTISRVAEDATLETSSDTVILNFDGKPVNMDITSNTSWTITGSQNWFIVNPEYGSGNKTVTFSADTNYLDNKRYSTLSLSSNGVLMKRIYVVQYNKELADDSYESNNTEATANELPVIFNDSTCSIKIQDLKISSRNDTDYFKIYLPAGSSYSVLGQSVTTSSNSQIYIKYKQGNSGVWNSQASNVTPAITSNGGEYIYFKVYNDIGQYSLDILINKIKDTPYLSVSDVYFSIGAEANSTATLDITSNSGWTVTSTSPWLKAEPSSGWRDGTVTITAEENNLRYNRTGYLYISNPATGQRVIYVNQAYTSSLSPDDFENNDSESASYELPLNFSNNRAFLKTSGSNLHNKNDVDYYKIYLPQGHTYSISTRLQDSFDSDDNEVYDADAKYSYKIGSDGLWSYDADTQFGDFISTGGYFYFKVIPYFSEGFGKYALQISVNILDENASLNISKGSLNLSYENLSYAKFNITSEGTTWNVSSSKSWLTPDILTGTGNAEITLTASENPGTSVRYATVTVSGNGVVSRKISINQAGKNYIPDIYESNNSETEATGLNLMFTNNEAVFIGSGLNIHTEDDRDYFKISLEDGYCYTVSASAENNTPWINYKTDGSDAWSNTYYYRTPEIYLTGRNDLYFKVTNSYKGPYKFRISVKREPFALSSSATDLLVDNASGSASFDISSNIDWVAYSSQSWLKLSNGSGEKNATITVTADDNLFAAERTATITLTGRGITKTITVTQAAAVPYLTVNSNTLSLKAAANSMNKFIISSNTNWTITSSQAWLTFNANSGSANGVITAVAEANTAQAERTAQITVSGSGFNKIITVTQNGANTDPTLSLSAVSLQVNNTENSTASFNITSNATWQLTSYEGWLKASKVSDTGNAGITLTAAANPTIKARIAEVSVAVPGISKTITVTQLPGDSVLNVSSNILTVNSLRNSFNIFDITSNIPWTVSSSQTWLEVNTGAGSGDATIMAKASANTDGETRSAVITVTGNTISRTITVTQEAAVSTLDVFENSFILSADANSSDKFNIASNASWTVSSSESWLTVDKNSGSDNSTVTFTAAANMNIGSRTATLTIAVSGKSHIISVTQAGLTTGTEDALNGAPQFYPNPVVNKLRIKFPGEKIRKNIKIYSEKGELRLDRVVEENTFETDMSGYQPGVYFIRITTEIGTNVFKVIRQ